MSILPIKLQDYQPAQSASALAKAIQTFNLFQDDLATEVIGFFLVGPCTRVIGINALFEGALDSAESVAVTLSKIDQDTGAATTIMTALAFTDANTPAGTQDFSDNLVGPFPRYMAVGTGRADAGAVVVMGRRRVFLVYEFLHYVA